MKKILWMLMVMLIATTAEAKPAVNDNDPGLAFFRPGPTFSFQFGTFYSGGYGSIVDRYAAAGVLPNEVFGVEMMTRFGLGYNINKNVGIEVAFADNGVDFNKGHQASSTTVQKFDFDIYNLETALVLKNGFSDLNSDIHAKFGLAYTYGAETISYHTTGAAPSWADGNKQFDEVYHAHGVAPLFDFGFSWSASQYLAYSLDYERVFKPIIGNSAYGDPLQSHMQATNMWLIGVLYHF